MAGSILRAGLDLLANLIGSTSKSCASDKLANIVSCKRNRLDEHNESFPLRIDVAPLMAP